MTAADPACPASAATLSRMASRSTTAREGSPRTACAGSDRGRRRVRLAGHSSAPVSQDRCAPAAPGAPPRPPVWRCATRQRARPGRRGWRRRRPGRAPAPPGSRRPAASGPRRAASRPARPARHRTRRWPSRPARRPASAPSPAGPGSTTSVVDPLSRTVAPVSSASRRACRSGAAVDVGALDRPVQPGQQPGQLAGVRREQGRRGARARARAARAPPASTTHGSPGGERLERGVALRPAVRRCRRRGRGRARPATPGPARRRAPPRARRRGSAWWASAARRSAPSRRRRHGGGDAEQRRRRCSPPRRRRRRARRGSTCRRPGRAPATARPRRRGSSRWTTAGVRRPARRRCRPR